MTAAEREPVSTSRPTKGVLADQVDRELLELAAKAAGIELQWDAYGVAWRKWPSFKWNPLTDDGDALRLANKLRINIQFGFEGDCIVDAYKYDGSCDAEESGIDQGAATRRAIVRAAAEIGRQA